MVVLLRSVPLKLAQWVRWWRGKSGRETCSTRHPSLVLNSLIPFKSVLLRSAPLKSALLRSAPLRSALRTLVQWGISSVIPKVVLFSVKHPDFTAFSLVLLRMLLFSSTALRLASLRLVPLRLAPLRFALFRLAPLRLASLKLTFIMLMLLKLAPSRLAPLRSIILLPLLMSPASYKNCKRAAFRSEFNFLRIVNVRALATCLTSFPGFDPCNLPLSSRSDIRS